MMSASISPSKPVPASNTAIHTPQLHDVLCGRGGTSNNHQGNAIYRSVVQMNKRLYRICPRSLKLKVSTAIVEAVHMQDPPGRFIAKNKETGLWYKISRQKAIEKTSQALKEALREALKEGILSTSPQTVFDYLEKEMPEAGDIENFIASTFSASVFVSNPCPGNNTTAQAFPHRKICKCSVQGPASCSVSSDNMTENKKEFSCKDDNETHCHCDSAEGNDVVKKGRTLHSSIGSYRISSNSLGGISSDSSTRKRQYHVPIKEKGEKLDTKKRSKSDLHSWLIGPKPYQHDPSVQSHSPLQGLENCVVEKTSELSCLQCCSFPKTYGNSEKEIDEKAANGFSALTIEASDLEEFLSPFEESAKNATFASNQQDINGVGTKQKNPISSLPKPSLPTISSPPFGMLLPATSLCRDISTFGPSPPSPLSTTKSFPPPDMLLTEPSLETDVSSLTFFASKYTEVSSNVTAVSAQGASTLQRRDNAQEAQEELQVEDRRSSLISDDGLTEALYECFFLPAN